MSRPIDDDTLLAALGEALAPEPAVPGPEAMAALHEALGARGVKESEDGSAVVVPFTQPKGRSATWAGIHRLRHPVTAAVAVGILATSGVAAAGVATDHLPGPTRSVAYALGLPVTSPALASAKGTINQLRSALASHDQSQVPALASLLRAQLAGLSAADRASIQMAAADLLARADSAGQGSTNGASGAGGSSTGAAASTGAGPSSGPGSSNGTGRGGANASNGNPATRPGSSSAGAAPGSSGSSTAGSGGTTSGTSSPGTPPAHTGSGGGSTPTTTPKPPPTTTPGTTPTTTPSTTSTTEPDDRGEPKGD